MSLPQYSMDDKLWNLSAEEAELGHLSLMGAFGLSIKGLCWLLLILRLTSFHDSILLIARAS